MRSMHCAAGDTVCSEGMMKQQKESGDRVREVSALKGRTT